MAMMKSWSRMDWVRECLGGYTCTGSGGRGVGWEGDKYGASFVCLHTCMKYHKLTPEWLSNGDGALLNNMF